MAFGSLILSLSKARSFLGQGVVDRLQVAAEGHLSGVLDRKTCKLALERTTSHAA